MKSLFTTLFCTIVTALISSKSAVNAEFHCLTGCAAGSQLLAVVDNAQICCGSGGGGFIPQLATPATDACEPCIDFQSVQPQIQTMVTPSTINLNQDATFSCTITSLATDVGAVIQWLGPNGTVLAESRPDANSLDLEFTPFAQDDLGDYKCIARVSTQPPGPVMMTVISRTITITPPPSAPVTINENQDPRIGETYTLTCRLNTPGQTIEWVDSEGNIINSGDGITVGETMSAGGVTTRELTIANLSLADTGYYTCRNPIHDFTQRVIPFFTPPSTRITEPSQPPTLGEPFEPECMGSTDIPGAMLTAIWFAPNGDILAMDTTMGREISLDLPLPPLSESNRGTYICRIIISSPLLDGPDVLSSNRFELNQIRPPVTMPGVTNPPMTDSPMTDPPMTDTLGQLVTGTTTTPPPSVTDSRIRPPPQVNECERGLDNCSREEICSDYGRQRSCTPVARCIDTDDGFECRCEDGFEGDGVTCTDINECDEETDNCLPDARCFNRLGSFVCRCKYGYIGDGAECCVRKRDLVRFFDDGGKTKKSKKTHTRAKQDNEGNCNGSKSTKKSKKKRSHSKSKCEENSSDEQDTMDAPMADNCIETTKSGTKSTSTTKSSSSSTSTSKADYKMKCMEIQQLLSDESCKAVIDDYIESASSKSKSKSKSKSRSKKRRRGGRRYRKYRG